MKVLIVSTNTLPASPSGPAYIAGAVLAAGHQVDVFECLFSSDIPVELHDRIHVFAPDVIGLSIRLVHGFLIDPLAEFNTRHVDLRLQVKAVVECIKQATTAPIVLGGPGFNYYASDWLKYLDVDYGIRGEADHSFPAYLKQLEQGNRYATVPGCVFRWGKQYVEYPVAPIEDLDTTAFPAYELFELDRYANLNISPAVLTKRGCSFRCTYCPYHSLEGARYRLKSPGRVVDEIVSITTGQKQRRIVFCDNNFNIPNTHARSICREIIDRKINIQWGTGDLLPKGVTRDFCQQLEASGCAYVNLSIESGSVSMLKRMNRGYRVRDVHEALDSLSGSNIPFSASLLIGSPGETPETIMETLDLLDKYNIPLGTWATIGICLWTFDQKVIGDAYWSGQFKEREQLFEGARYMSPDLSREFMVELISNLQKKKGYTVQVNKPFADYPMSSNKKSASTM